MTDEYEKRLARAASEKRPWARALIWFATACLRASRAVGRFFSMFSSKPRYESDDDFAPVQDINDAIFRIVVLAFLIGLPAGGVVFFGWAVNGIYRESVAEDARAAASADAVRSAAEVRLRLIEMRLDRLESRDR